MAPAAHLVFPPAPFAMFAVKANQLIRLYYEPVELAAAG
jgi:hypothetical protein